MEIEQEVEKILKKLKSEFSLTNGTSDALLGRIGTNLKAIMSAEGKMQEDAGSDNAGLQGAIPYGFDLDRFGALRTHPGLDIVQKQSNELRNNLKQLGIDEEAEKKKGKSLSSLDKLRKR